MEIEKINYLEIKPYHRNPRDNTKTIEPLKESIKKFGFKVPIVVDSQNVIITGHSRYKAIVQLKGQLDEYIKELVETNQSKKLIEELRDINQGVIPIIKGDDLTEEKVKEFRISDNKINDLSEWKQDDLMFELREIENAIGFEADEISKILQYQDSKLYNFSEEIEMRDEEEQQEVKQMLENRFIQDEENTKKDEVTIICPYCKEEFIMKLSEIKSNIRYKNTEE